MKSRAHLLLLPLVLTLALPSPGHARPLSESCAALLTRVKEVALIVRPRLGRPSAKGRGYDVRIAARSLFSPEELPSDLVARTMREMDLRLSRLSGLGFEMDRHIHVVVEADKRSVADHEYPFRKQVGRCAYVADEVADIRVKSFLFSKPLTIDQSAAARRPKFLVLPFMWGKPALDPFIVSHELGHVTRYSDVHPSLVWREARSDFIAYLITGNSTLADPVEKEILRDIQHPRIKHVSQIVADSRAHHDNSEIISHLLWQISEIYGKAVAAKLVNWIDRERVRPIRDVYVESIDEPARISFIGSIFRMSSRMVDSYLALVDERKKYAETFVMDESPVEVPGRVVTDEAIRAAIQTTIQDFADVVRLWLDTEPLDEEAPWVIEELLQRAGL